jgi:hypothetical protein
VFQEPAAVTVVFAELVDDVRADVAVLLLDLLRRLERRVGLAAVSKERLDKVGNVAAGNGDGFNGRANNVALGDRDDVRDTITGIDNRASERPVCDLG